MCQVFLLYFYANSSQASSAHGFGSHLRLLDGLLRHWDLHRCLAKDIAAAWSTEAFLQRPPLFFHRLKTDQGAGVPQAKPVVAARSVNSPLCPRHPRQGCSPLARDVAATGRLPGWAVLAGKGMKTGEEAARRAGGDRRVAQTTDHPMPVDHLAHHVLPDLCRPCGGLEKGTATAHSIAYYCSIDMLFEGHGPS